MLTLGSIDGCDVQTLGSIDGCDVRTLGSTDGCDVRTLGSTDGCDVRTAVFTISFHICKFLCINIDIHIFIMVK